MRTTEAQRRQFNIGDWVRVLCPTVARKKWDQTKRYAGSQRVLERQGWSPPQPLVGQIVGAVLRREGHVEPGYGDYDDYTPPVFTTTGTVLLWQVKLGVISPVLDVAVEDLVLLEPGQHPAELPWSYGYQWTAQDREEGSRLAKEQKRDARGRFTR